MNEMVRNYSGDTFDLTDPHGIEMALGILDHMRGKLVAYQEQTGNLYNLEATPAEGTTYRFAKEDKKRFPDIIQAGRSEEHTSELQSLMRISYAVFCLKKKT